MVEIGYQSTDNMVSIARGYHQLGVAIEVVELVAVHPLEDVAVSLGSVDVKVFELVGVPLEDMHGIKVGILAEADTEPIG